MTARTSTLTRRRLLLAGAWGALAVGATAVGWIRRGSPVERVLHRLVPTEADFDAVVVLGRAAIAVDPTLVGAGERALREVSRLPHGARVDRLRDLARRDATRGATVTVRGWHLPRVTAGLAAAAAAVDGPKRADATGLQYLRRPVA